MSKLPFEATPTVWINGPKVVIDNLSFENEIIASYLKNVPEEERKDIVISGLQIGVQALTRSLDHALIQNIQEARSQWVQSLTSSATQVSADVTRQREQLLNDLMKSTQAIMDSLRKEYSMYFGKSDGRVNEAFHKLQEDLDRQVQLVMKSVMDKFDPVGRESIPNKLASTINKAWKEQADAFKKILSENNPDNPLVLMAKENELWRKALQEQMGVFKRDVTVALQDMAKNLGKNEGTTVERTGSPRAGNDFQKNVHESLGFIARTLNDVLDDCSGSPGFLGTSKVGDHLITLNREETNGIKAIIAVESKSDQKQVKNESDLLKILDQTAENRGADVSILVASSEEILPRGCGQLKIYSANRIACVYDTDNSLPLQVAYQFARSMAKVRKGSVSTPTDERIDPVILGEYANRIESSLEKLRKTNTCLTTIKRESETAKNLIKEHEQNVLDIIHEMEDILHRKQRQVIEEKSEQAV